MGRSFRPQRVYQTAKINLAIPRNSRAQEVPPVWLKVIERIPPAEILTRPKPIPHREPNPRQRHPRNIFKPQRIAYPEDELRRNFFKDHPWELARPRVVVELDGKDARYVDWSRGLRQPGVPVTGESVVQRQLWLMENHEGITKEEAYDIARKELYDIRQHQDITRRIAQEEARMVGAYFGKSRLEVSMELENAVYEKWKAWAEGEAQKIEAERENAYANFGSNDEKSLELEEVDSPE
ncbi:mitochondrial 37S ribosomal protein S25 [Diaporthe helianthi]|uniref:37S ribosomal protein S25, mitochondrial n=1 Tax=Diaporthe helianthi TaxID=158607 RepID=A0A2P5IBP7_DIAHE|nr:mitochondrial 37S ribosomal protein S25 [Diaporthe helianthi]